MGRNSVQNLGFCDLVIADREHICVGTVVIIVVYSNVARVSHCKKEIAPFKKKTYNCRNIV